MPMTLARFFISTMIMAISAFSGGTMIMTHNIIRWTMPMTHLCFQRLAMLVTFNIFLIRAMFMTTGRSQSETMWVTFFRFLCLAVHMTV